MAVIKLMPSDIPRFWEAIKFACKAADNVRTEEFAGYANELLLALLNERAQCFIRFDENRVLQALAVTKIFESSLSPSDKYLYVQCLYSWAIVDNTMWADDMRLLIEFAKHTGCKRIKANGRHKRAFEVMTLAGLKEENRLFSMVV